SAPANGASAPAADGREIAFEATTLEYESDADVVVASGDVILRSGDQSVRADQITWNRETGQIVANGNIRFVDENGNQLFTDTLELTDELKAGAMTNLLLAFREGGRLAAAQGTRDDNGNILLERAAYSACPVVDAEGCARQPSWRVTARRVRYDEQTKKIRFDGAYLELFGRRVLPLPGLAVQADGGASSGFLVPDVGLTASNGVEVTGSYYARLAENRDLLLSGYVYTETAPMVSAQYRALTGTGAYQVTGFLTY